MVVLSKSFYERETKVVAQELLGKVLIRRMPQGIMAGKIIETEAYFGQGDPGSHASKGKTPRCAIMFGEPGRAYIYLNYGLHYLLNVVAEKEGVPGAVLIRALEPAGGVDLMFKNRPVTLERELTSGPAKLTQAMHIDLSFNGADLTQGNLLITEGEKEKFSIVFRPRIGIPVDKEELLRYYIKQSLYVSKR